MWSKKNNDRTLKASTLAELLVVMITASILLLAVTDGLNLFKKYSRSVTEQTLANRSLWDGYCRLESVVHSADSMALLDPRHIELFTEKDTLLLLLRDSLLLSSRNDQRGTLLLSVTAIELQKSDSGDDSLIVFLKTLRGRWRIALASPRKPCAFSEKLMEMEKKYSYE